MEEKKLKHGTPEYWRDWYWNRGGRDKVQYSRKVTQVLRKIENEKEKILQISRKTVS